MSATEATSPLTVRTVSIDDVDWTTLKHPDLPARAHAPRVKLLCHTVFLVLFPPGWTASRRTHRYNTTYFVIEGAIQFDDAPWVKTNAVRVASVGHVDNLQRAHPAVGVTFLLMSNGPLDLGWLTS